MPPVFSVFLDSSTVFEVFDLLGTQYVISDVCKSV